jgi:hypothetical protein
VDMHTVTGSFFNTENTITAACDPSLLERRYHCVITMTACSAKLLREATFGESTGRTRSQLR